MVVAREGGKHGAATSEAGPRAALAHNVAEPLADTGEAGGITEEHINRLEGERVQQILSSDEGGDKAGGGDDVMEQVAALYGASEVVRNSTQLVEAAFDGDLDELKNWIDKGYHLESTDGRKHTALSEAACQGHMHVVAYLLEHGADPNALSDTGRSPMWRAAFNNHVAVVNTLLQAGCDPDFRDKVSMETAFDVTQSDELREILGSWDRQLTASLIESRRRTILAKIEERIKTGAEREQFAREKIRQELVAKAEAGDTGAFCFFQTCAGGHAGCFLSIFHSRGLSLSLSL